MQISLDGVAESGRGLFRATLSPAEARLLGTTPNNLGATTVLLLSEYESYDRAKRRLSFSPAQVHLLNVGTTADALIVLSDQTKRRADGMPGEREGSPQASSGDGAFLKSLPDELLPLGRQFLECVRRHFAGNLRFFPESKRYVETPDNFWTIKCQPRSRNFAITVRGRPAVFGSVGAHLVLKDDRPGYTRFSIGDQRDVDPAIAVLRRAVSRGAIT
jgi:hypothetical protein